MNVDEAAKLVGYYQYVFNSAEGELVMEDIGVRCGVLAGNSAEDPAYFAGPSMTAEQRAYRDGQQDAFKAIEAMAQK